MVGSKQPDDFTLLRWLRMGRDAERALSDALSAVGLAPDQFQILLMIGGQPGVSAVTIAQALALDAPTVSRLVNGLAQRGLLDRRRARNDRRMVRLRLTPDARGLLGEARAAVTTADQAFVEQLGPAGRRALERLSAPAHPDPDR